MWVPRFVCSAFVPSTEADADQMIQWLENYTAATNDAEFTAAATAARGLPAARRLTGSKLYDTTLAQLQAMLPGVPSVVLAILQLDWQLAVQGTPDRPPPLFELRCPLYTTQELSPCLHACPPPPTLTVEQMIGGLLSTLAPH